mmetsp:Transcript_123154/g.353809  ORF Transcript_123154/g.353809 Transcript_123154/m.353809 type:complete len:378 (+) Transcript_123154:387-1520(+)
MGTWQPTTRLGVIPGLTLAAPRTGACAPPTLAAIFAATVADSSSPVLWGAGAVADARKEPLPPPRGEDAVATTGAPSANVACPEAQRPSSKERPTIGGEAIVWTSGTVTLKEPPGGDAGELPQRKSARRGAVAAAVDSCREPPTALEGNQGEPPTRPPGVGVRLRLGFAKVPTVAAKGGVPMVGGMDEKRPDTAGKSAKHSMQGGAAPFPASEDASGGCTWANAPALAKLTPRLKLEFGVGDGEDGKDPSNCLRAWPISAGNVARLNNFDTNGTTCLRHLLALEGASTSHLSDAILLLALFTSSMMHLRSSARASKAAISSSSSAIRASFSASNRDCWMYFPCKALLLASARSHSQRDSRRFRSLRRSWAMQSSNSI